MEDLHTTLQTHLPSDLAAEVNRILYGNPCRFLLLTQKISSDWCYSESNSITNDGTYHKTSKSMFLN